jgi:hypothetical protein
LPLVGGCLQHLGTETMYQIAKLILGLPEQLVVRLGSYQSGHLPKFLNKQRHQSLLEPLGLRFLNFIQRRIDLPRLGHNTLRDLL